MLRAVCEFSVDRKVFVTASPDFAKVILNNKPTKSIKFVGEVNSEKLAELYRRSRVVLNANPGYESLISGRVRNAMTAGCAILTDESRALSKVFTQSEDILYFKSKILNTILPKKSDILETIGRAGQAKIKKQLKNQSFIMLLQKIGLFAT